MTQALKDTFSTAAFCTICAGVVGGAAALAAIVYTVVLSPAMADVAQYAAAGSGVIR